MLSFKKHIMEQHGYPAGRAALGGAQRVKPVAANAGYNTQGPHLIDRLLGGATYTSVIVELLNGRGVYLCDTQDIGKVLVQQNAHLLPGKHLVGAQLAAGDRQGAWHSRRWGTRP